MKTYVVITGAIFGLLTLAHLWRMVEEGSHLATDPLFVLVTLASGALCLWACRIYATQAPVKILVGATIGACVGLIGGLIGSSVANAPRSA